MVNVERRRRLPPIRSLPMQALRHGQAARQSRWVSAIDRQWPFAGAIALSFNVIAQTVEALVHIAAGQLIRRDREALESLVNAFMRRVSEPKIARLGQPMASRR